MDEMKKNKHYAKSPVEEQKSEIFCNSLQRFHRFLTKLFYKLGLTIALNPSYFIIIPVFVTSICITGLQNMVYEKDPEYLFSPSNGLGRTERKVVEDLFPMDYSNKFDPSRITRISSFARLLVSAKDNGTMFRTQIWDDLMDLDKVIQNLTVEWQDVVYTYDDVCAKWDSKCIENQILNLNEIMPEVENGTMWVDYPFMLFPLIYPFFYGGAEINETEGTVNSVKYIALTYWLREDNWRQKERSHMFEDKVLELIDTTHFERLSVERYVSMSLEEELEENTSSILFYLPPTVFIMFFFTTLSIFTSDWVRSKIQIGVMGILTAGLATGCSFGLLMYCGVPFIGINVAAPFLLLGIGIDDMFVVLSAWQRTKIQDNVPIRLAEAYSEASVSITITSLTNMLSFFIGSFTPFPSVYIFCVYTGVAILMTYIFFITFFGGCLAVAGYQEQKQKHVLTFKTVKSNSESVSESIWYRFWCSGGISNEDPYNPVDNKPHTLMVFFRDYYAKMLNNPIMKVIILLLFVGYLGGAIHGCLQMKEGLEKRNLALDDSYMIDYYDVEDVYFRKFPYRIQVIIKEELTYSDPEVKKHLIDLHETFENLTCIGSKIYTQSWIRDFYRFVSIRPNLKEKIVDEESFIKVLKEDYLQDNLPESVDIIFNENGTRILASRFVIQSYDVKDTNGDKDMMQAVRKVAQDSKFNVYVYYPFFVLFDQFLLIAPLTLQTIMLVAVVMMIVSLVFIPNPFCCLWVIFSIVSIETGVIGYMTLWGVSLDCISMINLIMCIGFSVDFSAHISYAYLTAKCSSPDERVKECLYSLGLPVAQSGLSTIAGVLIFVVAPSYIFETFFKVIFLVIVFGIMHAIVLLPVLLSLLGPGTCTRCSCCSGNINITDDVVEVISEVKSVTPISMRKISDIVDEDVESGISQSSMSSLNNHDSAVGGSDTESIRTQSRSVSPEDCGGTCNEAYVQDE